ncbi:Peritrophin-48, partial [Cyphomyrmex costatus]
GIHLIAIAFLASWTVITASKLPIIFETEDECPVLDIFPHKLISHKTDCTKYYECKSGYKQLLSCKVGLYFSKKWQGCVRREISDCQLPPIPTPDQNVECPVQNECPSKLIPHKECDKYYECKDGEKLLRSCRSGLYFSQKWHGCVRREISDCPILTDECPVVDTCPLTVITDETDCTKYYECKNSKKEPRSCNPGLYFSKKWHGCVRLEISDCFLTTQTPTTPTPTTPTPTTPTPTTPTIPTPTPQCINGDLLQHECTCTKYYVCVAGHKALFECPAGNHFDNLTKTCQPGTDCLQVTPRPISSPTSISIISQCTEDEYTPHEYECKKYYECKVGRKALRECNDGMYFDEALRTCVLGQCLNDPIEG